MKISFVKRALRYAEGVCSGKIPAPKTVLAACQRHLDDLIRSKDPGYPYRFDEKKGNRICDFAERMVHVKGKWAKAVPGELPFIHLEDWQCFTLAVPFGWVRKSDGLRRFREIYEELPRKNAKSTKAAVIGLFMAFADDEPGAEAFAGATSIEQANAVFKPAWLMVQNNPEFQEHFGLELGGTATNPGPIVQLSTGSSFRPIIGKPGDGDSPHCAVVDEYHEHVTPVMYDAMKTGMGARTQPMLVVITTAGVDTSGPCYDKHLEAEKVLNGTLENDELFTIIYAADLEDHSINYGFTDGMQCMVELCSCNANIKIEQILREACAKAVTENGLRSIGRSNECASIIQTGSIITTADAGTAQKNGSEIRTQNIGARKSSNLKSGVKETGSVKLRTRGHGSPEIRTSDQRPSLDSDSKSTDFQGPSSKSLEFYSKENAASAETCQKFLSLITTISQALSGDSFAIDATRGSVFSEILCKAYNAHSNTCPVRIRLRYSDTTLCQDFPALPWANFELWKVVNPNFGVSVMEDFLRAQLRNALQNPSDQNINLTKHLGRWMTAGAAWMNMAIWAQRRDDSLHLESFARARCWLGMDLASKIDIASLAYIIEAPWGWAFFCKHYLPEETIELPENAHYRRWRDDPQAWLTQTDGAVTDFKRIEDDIRDAAKMFSVQALAFDQRESGYLINNIQQEFSFPCIDVPQGPANISQPMKEMEGAIYGATIRHNGDPVLTWMMGNVIKKSSRTGGPVKSYYPTRQNAKNKIDGVVAGIMALSQALIATPPKKFQMIFV